MSNKLKKKLPNIIFGLVFLVGICVILYPPVSNYINSRHQSKAVASYEDAISAMDTVDYDQIWQKAYEYNQALSQRPMSFKLTDEELAEYNSVLDPTGYGVIGTIEIENIGVNLPIYHGTTETALQVGIGHLEGTSLPTGTPGTHVVLSGHRGLPSSKLFTDLDQMIVGDTFLLHIMNKTFVYQVDQINIVLPEETNDLAIVDGKEYVTLVTCTPYGVNTHRLLVRGKRVDYTEENRLIVPADASRYGTLIVALFIGTPILLMAFIVYLVMTSKWFRNRKKADSKPHN